MKKLCPFLLIIILHGCHMNPDRQGSLSYEPNERYPYGRANPAAPSELAQFGFMIGSNDCAEQRLDNGSGDWVESTRSWDAYYFMNGFAIRDGGKSAAGANGNIRVFDAATKEWVVTFFSAPIYGSGTWRGKMEEGKIVLRQPQKAPGTDFDGFSTLSFLNISDQGFDWSGEWISEDETVAVPFWRMQCHKVAVG